jgi:hypothetical protein
MAALDAHLATYLVLEFGASSTRWPSPAAGQRRDAGGGYIVAAPRVNPWRADGLCSPNIAIRAAG